MGVSDLLPMELFSGPILVLKVVLQAQLSCVSSTHIHGGDLARNEGFGVGVTSTAVI